MVVKIVAMHKGILLLHVMKHLNIREASIKMATLLVNRHGCKTYRCYAEVLNVSYSDNTNILYSAEYT